MQGMKATRTLTMLINDEHIIHATSRAVGDTVTCNPFVCLFGLNCLFGLQSNRFVYLDFSPIDLSIWTSVQTDKQMVFYPQETFSQPVLTTQ
jgi:hypothetical protein